MHPLTSAVPRMAPAALSAGNGSVTTVARGLTQTFLRTASSQTTPVQNCADEQALPHAPQLRGSLLVSVHQPPQQLSAPGQEDPASPAGPASLASPACPASPE